ncbi:hypothetical protein N7470_003614 [Penicillium chermesinum]|nr:hypothetical protein N7470_003614 [Penicillium chermesinum]
MPPQNILLFGATGTIGKYILSALLSARSQFQRIAIFTSPNTAATKKRPPRRPTTARVGNIEDEQAVKAAYEVLYWGNLFLTDAGIDTVISALGRGSLAQQIPLIRLAAASSVRLFLPSEYGTDIAYGPASAHEKPHQQKLKVRAFLEKEVSRAELDYAYVVTGPFAEMYLHFIPGVEAAGGWDVEGRRAVLLGDTGRRGVGTLTLAVLLHATPEVLNRALTVNSFTTSPAEIQAEFERQTRQVWKNVSRTSLAQLREEERKAWEAGIPAATGITLRRIWTEGGTLYAQRSNGLLGEPKMGTLAEVVAGEINRDAPRL